MSDDKRRRERGSERREGEVRTSMHCHQCGHTFIALLDYSINGDHVACCPFCGHEHCRTIKDGLVTEARWDHREGTDKDRDTIHARAVWAADIRGQSMRTTSAADFIWGLWINRER